TPGDLADRQREPRTSSGDRLTPRAPPRNSGLLVRKVQGAVPSPSSALRPLTAERSASRDPSAPSSPRSCRAGAARRRLAALAVHVASAKVLLGRQQIVGRTAKLQVVHGVRAAQRVRFAVVQLQAASLRTAPSSIVGVGTP